MNHSVTGVCEVTRRARQDTHASMRMYVHAHRVLRLQARRAMRPKAERRARIVHAMTLFAAGWLQRHGPEPKNHAHMRTHLRLDVAPEGGTEESGCGEAEHSADVHVPDQNEAAHTSVSANLFVDVYDLGDIMGRGSYSVVRRCVSKVSGEVSARFIMFSSSSSDIVCVC